MDFTVAAITPAGKRALPLAARYAQGRWFEPARHRRRTPAPPGRAPGRPLARLDGRPDDEVRCSLHGQHLLDRWVTSAHVTGAAAARLGLAAAAPWRT
ncbi:hypothetical protein ACH41H_29275 [Streptomyces sp. NPDC020800]|uniref:hypothetical protein n=1 Tax=Streptomyces sp. NPDC020800 TaxID=3365092 RepID=UPI00379E4FCF